MIADRARYTGVARSHRELEAAHRLAEEYRRAESDAAGAEELLQAGNGEVDAADRSELQQMVSTARARMLELEEDLRLAMLEKDPNDSKNVIVEIRAGAGGDEAALFAGDLYRMLTKYAEQKGFKSEALSISAAEVGGFKEVVFEIRGEGAYSVFKYEAGVHRVQRVPKTESQGRIHTSTATVAVLPEAEDVEVEVDPNDLQIDVYRSSGPRRAVRQHDGLGCAHNSRANGNSRIDARREVTAPEPRARDEGPAGASLRRALHEQQAELAADRRAQVGTGERSEKVRTYNFPQGRVTDHRIKLTTHNLPAVLEGELGEFTDALSADERRRQLEAQAA